MQEILNEIKEYTLEFIADYTFKIPNEKIVQGGLKKIRVLYKGDYFNEDSKYYKKGIGDIIVTFHSGYIVVIKETADRVWCFALKDKPYNIVEEVWILSEKQQAVLPMLRIALEKGFPYRNEYCNLNFE